MADYAPNSFKRDAPSISSTTSPGIPNALLTMVSHELCAIYLSQEREEGVRLSGRKAFAGTNPLAD